MLSDMELKLINKAFTNYFDKQKTIYKEVFYKYRIEIFTHHYTIYIKYKIGLNNDYCVIKVYNDITNKNLEKTINYEDKDFFDSFDEEKIKNLLNELN